jgi:hypothetical protein
MITETGQITGIKTEIRSLVWFVCCGIQFSGSRDTGPRDPAVRTEGFCMININDESMTLVTDDRVGRVNPISE